MTWALELLLGVAAVDFVSGLVHWAEDTFGTETTPIVGPWIVAPNVLHHRDASAFVGRGWFASSWDLALAAAIVAAVAVLGGWFGPGVVAFALLGPTRTRSTSGVTRRCGPLSSSARRGGSACCRARPTTPATTAGTRTRPTAWSLRS